MKLTEYKQISDYFTEQTNLPCEFVIDLATLFLKIDGKLYQHQRKINEPYTPEEVIEIFKNQVFGK